MSLSNYPEIWAIACIILICVVWGLWRTSEFNKHGVVSVCKILRVEDSGGGADMYVEVYVKKKRFVVIVNEICLSCVGNYVYSKTIPGNRKDLVVYISEKVPNCVGSNLENYDSGWDSIPKDPCGN